VVHNEGKLFWGVEKRGNVFRGIKDTEKWRVNIGLCMVPRSVSVHTSTKKKKTGRGYVNPQRSSGTGAPENLLSPLKEHSLPLAPQAAPVPTYKDKCRSQWDELSSPARTLVSWVLMPLDEWISVCVSSVFVLFCVQVPRPCDGLIPRPRSPAGCV
jgi:hypothetical protein